MMNHRLTASILLSLLAAPCFWAATAAANPPAHPAGYNDSGVELNRTRQYLERQRIARKIKEGRDTQQVEGTEGAEEKQKGTVRFLLKQVELPESQVLSKEELQKITGAYEGKEVTLDDLYALVGKINGLYQEKGYLTCRAFLAPQTIREGKVKIDLVEGKNGQVEVTGNRSTREKYITDRLHIEPGQISSMHSLNKDLLRFNATNDAQLRIALKAGEKPGTTDYVIAVQEPQKQVTGVFFDNAGSKTSGLYRAGLFWQDRDLSGNRDHLFISTIRSEGMKAVAGSYSTPINRTGTRAGISYSTNSVHITDGPFEALGVRGHSYVATAFLVSPIETTERKKSEWGFEYGHQRSETDFGTSLGLRTHWVDDTVDTGLLYYDQLNYGDSSVLYQKHGYRVGRYKDLYDNHRNFGKYEFNGLYQKAYKAGQQWTFRLDGQLSSTQYLPSSEMFYLGGMYSVRGYTESLIGGDGGFSASAEYSVPLDKGRKVNGYLFLDGGRIWGSSAFGDRSLMGAGVGIKADLTEKISLNVALGLPLQRTINGAEQSRGRIHFTVNGQF